MARAHLKRFFLSVLCGFLLIGMGMPAGAAAYPTKSVQLLVPWGAGGDSDAAMRIFAHFLSEELGRPVVVVNVPGAGGNLGNRQGKDAAPDGYTLTMIHESVVASSLVGMVNFTYQDFDLIANVTYSPMYLASRPNAPWNNAQEMLDYARANPGKITFGATLGSVSHFFPLDVAHTGKADIRIIGYDGTAKRMQGLLGGFIDLGEVNPGTASDLVNTGRLKMLGSASEERFELTPDIPTLKEQGLPVFIGLTRGIVVPKGTPEAILARLEEAARKVCENPEFQERIKTSGSVAYFRDRAEYAKLLADMTVRMRTLAETFNILKK
jgi:tripartite-type tricarboxylate transporter receptor subunit TctC